MYLKYLSVLPVCLLDILVPWTFIASEVSITFPADFRQAESKMEERRERVGHGS